MAVRALAVLGILDLTTEIDVFCGRRASNPEDSATSCILISIRIMITGTVYFPRVVEHGLCCSNNSCELTQSVVDI
jgi:hypothetical protein